MKKILFAALTVLFAMSMFSFIAAQKKDWNVPAKYKTMKALKKGDKASIDLGKTLYTKYCKSCHGGSGKGDGPKAGSMKTPMDDFTAAAFKSLPDGTRYFMSFVGRDEMPNFEKKIVDEEERWAIINYMSTL